MSSELIDNSLLGRLKRLRDRTRGDQAEIGRGLLNEAIREIERLRRDRDLVTTMLSSNRALDQ